MPDLDSIPGALTTAVLDLIRPKGQRVALAATDRFDAKTCLVTGANRGLGRGVAIGLARRGARLILACRTGIPRAGAEMARLTGNPAVEMLPVDLADLDSVDALVDTLARWSQSSSAVADVAVF